MKPALGPGSPSVILVSDLDDRMNWSWRAKPEVVVARRAEVLDQVLDDELPRYAEALGRLGRWSV